MQSLQRWADILEASLVKEFVARGFDIDDDNGRYVVYSGGMIVDVTELTNDLMEALALPAPGIKFEDFIGEEQLDELAEQLASEPATAT
jgi:hypothetical protein